MGRDRKEGGGGGGRMGGTQSYLILTFPLPRSATLDNSPSQCFSSSPVEWKVGSHHPRWLGGERRND